MTIYCIVPAYNERENIRLLNDKLIRQFEKLNCRYRILYIIQGKDGSLDIVRKIKKVYPAIDFRYHAQPLGIGLAYLEGFKLVPKSFQFVLTLDADLNHDPSDLPKFIKTMIDHRADIVIGSRFIRGGKFADRRIWKRYISRGVNMFITRLFGFKVHDISSGYRLIKNNIIRQIIPYLRETGYPAYIEFILLAYKYGFKIEEVPITYASRIWGRSKMGISETLRHYIKFLFRLSSLKNPD